MTKPLMDDLSFLRKGPEAPAEETSLYHVGMIPGSPVSNFTAGGQSIPLLTWEYRGREVGSCCEGAIVSYTPKNHARAVAKVDRTIVEWVGSPAGEDLKQEAGVGPGGRFTRAKVKDKTEPGFECVAENCEPLSKYVFIFPVASVDALHTGIKPTLMEMRTGQGGAANEEKIAALEAELAERRRTRELLSRATRERSEAAEAESKNPSPGRKSRIERPANPQPVAGA